MAQKRRRPLDLHSGPGHHLYINDYSITIEVYSTIIRASPTNHANPQPHAHAQAGQDLLRRARPVRAAGRYA